MDKISYHPQNHPTRSMVKAKRRVITAPEISGKATLAAATAATIINTKPKIRGLCVLCGGETCLAVT